MRQHVRLFVFVSAFLAAQPCLATASENIARGKSYRLQPRPNYRHCTDAADRVQLTDGVYTEGYFWTQPTTVGWVNANPAIVTIDLGEIQPIGGVSYNTAAGRAGVTWPRAIMILVSDDDETYYAAGDLVRLTAADQLPKPGEYAIHRYRTEQLHTHGRFVKLLITGDGPYTFVDEIEVMRGPASDLRANRPGTQITDVQQYFGDMQVERFVRRRLRNDLAAVRSAAPVAFTPQLDRLEREIEAARFPVEDDFTTVFPLNELHRRLFAVQAAIWRRTLDAPLVIWQKNRWDMLSPTEPPRRDGAKLAVSMMRGERRSAAFNLSNSTSQPIAVRLHFEGVPGGPLPDYVDVHEVLFTDTRSGVPIAAALPPARRDGTSCSVTVEPGLTKQIWLSFHPSDLPPGRHEGTVRIAPGSLGVPLLLHLYPLEFPERPSLHVGGWDYTDVERGRDVTPDNRAALIRHLKERFVDTPWATRGVLPRGTYDAEGNLIEAPSDENLRNWLALWPDARKYCVFAAVSDRFDRFPQGTPPFKRAVADWITFWVRRLKQLGVEPSRLGLLLVDEPHRLEQDTTIIEYAQVIQQAEPDVLIWEDPTWRKPWEARPELFEQCDILCPNLPMWIEEGPRFADFYVRQRDAGRTLWFYSCSGPGKLLDPYSYHRMQPWFCWRYEAKGSCFWSFSDSNGASSWNEYRSLRGAFTPVFLAPDSVTPGKHMEAIREGVEDYEYLRMLRDRIARAEQTDSVSDQMLAAARRLLDRAADHVTACMTEREKINWQVPKDRSVADQVRVEILEMLCRLE